MRPSRTDPERDFEVSLNKVIVVNISSHQGRMTDVRTFWHADDRWLPCYVRATSPGCTSPSVTRPSSNVRAQSYGESCAYIVLSARFLVANRWRLGESW